jgi:two-component system sensor histidine kinase BaeS
MRPPRVPPHRSLVIRLLATSILVAVGATVSTAWLAAQSTSRTIRQELGRSLTDDKSVYDALLGYAATHRDWSQVGPVVAERAEKLDRRVTLMTEDRQVIADSADGPSLRDARPSATVDPLRVDLGLTGRSDRIDPRAVGPYRLPPDEQAALRKRAEEGLACVREYDYDGQIRVGPSGRPEVVFTTTGPKPPWSCALIPPPTKTEQLALRDLRDLVADCAGEPAERLEVQPDFFVLVIDYRLPGDATRALAKRAQACVEKSRQEQLSAYVAEPALLFVTDPANPAGEPVFNLSRTNAVRIALVVAAVLGLAILITIVVGGRLVRPLRALTEAARQPAEHQRVPVTTRDEIGHLATALNELSARREQLEHQRKAMVNDVAHELRTPLTSIRSWLEAAQDGLATVDGPLLDLLLDETVQLQHIVDDLRDLAAADAGNLRIHPEPIYVNDVLDQVATAHRPDAATAGVLLCTEFDADPEMAADPVRLRQLVGNLVSNAIRHTPAGGSVTIRTALATGQLAIAVVDTGVGIAPGDLPKVFDRFWRADDSRSRTTGGSGLGLAIARKLAEAHGGTITVASSPGEGTTFRVILPGTALPAIPAPAR